MKKTYILIGLSLAIITFAVILMFRQDGSTIENEFYITDTSSVTKIFLADMDNHSVLLQKKSGGWLVNNEFDAIHENVELLLKTMLRIEIKHLLSKSATQTGLKHIMTKHTKVEIYQNKGLFRLFGKEIFSKERLTKVYYVGGPTQDNQGTLMKLEEDDNLYITHLPGMNGYLSERYSAIPGDWKSHELFRLGVNQIKEIELEFPETPEQNYKIINNLDRSFQLIQTSTQQNITHYDTLALLRLVAAFGNINFEATLDNMSDKRIDSLLHSQAYRIIKVKTVDGEEKQLTMYHRFNFDQILDVDGVPFPYDVDRMYAFEKDSRDAVSVQFFVVDDITRHLKYLAPHLFPSEESEE